MSESICLSSGREGSDEGVCICVGGAQCSPGRAVGWQMPEGFIRREEEEEEEERFSRKSIRPKHKHTLQILVPFLRLTSSSFTL